MPPEATDPAKYGAWIRAARENAGLTIAQAAELASMSSDGLSRIERNRTSVKLSTLERLADVYGIMVGDMLPKSEVPTANRLAEPLLAALAGMPEDEISRWMNMFAQQATLARMQAERYGKQLTAQRR